MSDRAWKGAVLLSSSKEPIEYFLCNEPIDCIRNAKSRYESNWTWKAVEGSTGYVIFSGFRLSRVDENVIQQPMKRKIIWQLIIPWQKSRITVYCRTSCSSWDNLVKTGLQGGPNGWNKAWLLQSNRDRNHAIFVITEISDTRKGLRKMQM